MIRRQISLRLGLAVVCFSFISLLFCSSVYAETKIKASQIEGPIATFNLKRVGSNQGGNVTKDSYVFVDCNRDHCKKNALIRVFNKKSCKQTKSMNWNGGRLSGIFAGWSNGTISLINNGSRVGCRNSKSNSQSGCATPPGLSFARQGTGQGASYYYNNHTYKVAGYTQAYIAVRGGGSTSYYVVPKSAVGNKSLEPEGISVDHDTGDVYISYDRKKTSSHPRQIQFWKIKGGVLKGTKRLKNSSPTICKADGSSSGGSDSGSDSGSSGGGSATPSTPRPDRQEAPTPDYDGSVETTFFDNFKDKGDGCGTFMLLNFIIEILTWGIGIAALVGILIAGITYMTAGGEPGKVIKAKNRIVQIVIGLALYATLWAALNWLLPGGQFTISTQCEKITSQEK